ncbi:MBL fold metallo-hydrolase [Actinoplanes sp. N902-109]|uniref:MBL fold metallo-hydrolase n=1 Tax=Actinoplanes sp. (strain N902-109) TaxID=649831 RepID=UPI0005A134BE|nr:MBL fold metallo-hydrolase [Actinoplanes sp. N902-109]
MTVNATVTFVGNATTVLRLGEFTLLTDPAFGPAGSRVYLGKGAWTRRLKDPALEVVDLAALDGVVLSHLHGDHFDRFARRALPVELPIVTTEAAARTLRRRYHFTASDGLATWDSRAWTRGDQRLRITSVPGKHGPGLVDRMLPDVMGTVLELTVLGRRALRLYITGDTLYGPWLSDIPRRCGEIDAMLIHLGGTRLMGLLLTMDDKQGVEATHMIRPGLTVPIHNDDYRVQKTPMSAYLARAREQGLTGIKPIARGATLDLPVRV